MGMQIKVKNWKVLKGEDGTPKIAGSYSVLAGSVEVAKQDFNDGYGSVAVPFPASLVAEIEALDNKVKEAIANHYNLEA